VDDFGKPVKEEGELRLVKPTELNRVEIHPVIKEVIAETGGLRMFHQAMRPKRLPQISKWHPAIILRNRHKLILIGNFIYFYEALLKNCPVYARIVECNDVEAYDQATEEAYTRPLHITARQGDGLKMLDKNGAPQTTQLTTAGRALLLEIYDDGKILERVLAELRILAPLDVTGQILQFPHATIGNWTERMGLRVRPKRYTVPKTVLDRPKDWLPLPPPRVQIKK
jgi:hypothetical protein